MKYFTKELYEEMQVYGSLVYVDSLEDQEEEKAWFNKEGRDYYGEALKRFELISPYMVKYLPESLQKYVKDKRIMDCNIPDVKMMEEITSWRRQWEDKWRYVCDKYKHYTDSIYNDLPEGLRKLGKNIRMHDATIMNVTAKEDTLELVINTVENKVFQFVFTQVKLFEYQENPIDNCCLYTEIALLGQDVFEVQILLSNSINTKQFLDTNEVRIIASDFKNIEIK